MTVARGFHTWHTIRGWVTLIAALLCAGKSLPGWAQQVNTQDYSRITQVPRAEMDAWLKQEVAASGGNWNVDRYHFYIGFSTGHFGQDPVHAIAMRRLAFSLMNNSLATGDRVTPFAWEMTTWNVGPSIPLTGAPASRAEFVNGVPYAPHSGSQGGHDIERVLYETVTKAIPASETHSAIVLLLTNSNASQSPTGERANLFGADNPQLAAALRQGKFRLPPVRKEFRLQAGAQPVTVAVTALFPQKLAALSDTPNSPRYPTFARETWQPQADQPASTEVLPNPAQHGPAPPKDDAGHHIENTKQRTGIAGWVWVAALLVAAMIAGAWLLRSRRSAASAAEKTRANTPPSPAVISGSLTVTIGPDAQTLETLTMASQWLLLRGESGKITLVEAPSNRGAAGSPADKISREMDATLSMGTPLAKLTFDQKRFLHVNAEVNVQFLELQGASAGHSDSRHLLVEPGKSIFCRLLPPETTTKTRLEVAYHVQKGSRV